VRAKAVALNPNLKTHTAAVLTLGASEAVEVFDTNTGVVLQNYLALGKDSSGNYSGITYSADGKYLVFSQDSSNVPLNTSSTRFTIPHYISTQLNFEGEASYGRRYSTHEHYGTFEMGVKVRNAHKTQNENDLIFDNQPGTTTLANVLGGFRNPCYYDHAYQFGPMSDYGKIVQQVGGNLNQLGYDASSSIGSSIPADFDANERVYAGYLMNTIGFGKLSVQTGVRFEATDATYRSAALDVNGNPTSVPGSSSYINVLPSIQLQYRLQQNTLHCRRGKDPVCFAIVRTDQP